MPGIGIAEGLSYVNDWSKDIDRIYQREEYAARLRSENERKALFYGEQLKRGHGSNQRTEAELDEYYKGLNNELANFVTENPNFERDVTGMQKFLDISGKYLNNPILQTDQQVKQEFDKLRQAVSAGTISEEKYWEEMGRYNEYIDPVKKGSPYVFTNFKLKDPAELLDEMSKLVQPETGPVFKEPLSHTYQREKILDPAAIRNTVYSFYANKENKQVMDKDYNTLMAQPGSEKFKSEYPDVITYWKKRLEYTKGNEFDVMAPDYEWQQQMQKLYAPKSGSQSETSYHFLTELEKLRNMSLTADPDTGQKVPTGRMPANNAYAALTKAQTLNTEFSIAPSDSVLVENQSLKQYTPIDFPIKAKLTNVSEAVHFGGNYFVNGNIKFNVGGTVGMGSDRADSLIMDIPDAELRNRGFTSGGLINIPIVDIGGNQIGTRPGREWSGPALIPMKLNYSGMVQYEHLFTGMGEQINKTAPFYQKYEGELAAKSGSPKVFKDFIRNNFSDARIIGGIDSVKFNQALSDRENEPYATMVDTTGRKIAINLNTKKLRELNYLPKK